MIELRWVWHDREKNNNTTGTICVDGEGKYLQKLQYRTKTASPYVGEEYFYSEWKDVPHSGEVI